MPKILITQAEVDNHSNLPNLFNATQSMDCNGVQCVYASISQNNLDANSQSWNSDAWEGVLLPKEVVQG